MPDSNGNVLSLQDVNVDHIDARKAWPILKARGFTDEDLTSAVRMSKTSIMATVSSRAVRGQKGRVKAALADELREAGAITQTTQRRLKVEREPS